MEKRKRGRPKKVAIINQNEQKIYENNNLAQALGLGVGFGFPQNQGSPFTEQVEQGTTLWKNLRWYLISNFRQLLNQLFVEIGLVKTICVVPVEDALRGGIKIKSKELHEKQVETLSISVDRDEDLRHTAEAAIWMRLLGGGVILVLTDQDPVEPLDLASIGPDDALEFRAADMWEVTWETQNVQGFDPTTQAEDFQYYNYYGKPIHKSRVMTLKGLTPPSFIRPRLRGWGLSEVETLVRSINQFLKGTDLLFEVLDEFKVDVFKFKGLTNSLLSPIGRQKVQERVQIAAMQKNYQNALTMDKEDDWEHKQVDFSGLADALFQIRLQVAADMRMPLTKLFGQSATGFNSGEDDIEVYNAMVEGQVRSKLKYVILRMLEIKCQKLFGFVPSDLSIEFEPLRVMSSEQEQNIKSQKMDMLVKAQQAGWISAEQAVNAANAGDLFDIKLENDVVIADQTDVTSEGVNNPYKSKDTNNPGEARADTRASKSTEVGGAAKGPKNPKAASIPESKGPKSAKAPITPKTKNSAEFDRRAYEADGGELTFDMRRKEFFMNPKDKELWKKCEEQAGNDFAYAIWLYRDRGGRF